MAEIPRYEQYSLSELIEALNSIVVANNPEAFAALENEFAARDSQSRFELEECYFALDKVRWPEHAARLRRQIESMGGFSVNSVELVTEENKYRTFWRRVGAAIIDSLIIIIPAIIIASIFHESIIANPMIAVYVDEGIQYVLLAYSIILHARYGQTFGKMAAGVKVVDVSEERTIGYRQALLRDSVPLVLTILASVYLVVFGVTYDEGVATGTGGSIAGSIAYFGAIWGLSEMITMLFNRKRRAVHDFIARTVVIRIP